MIRLFLYCILFSFIWSLNIFAFDNDVTHRDLTQQSIRHSILTTSTFVQDKLGLLIGTTNVINKRTIQ